jgi:hypothetical protein
MRNKKSATQATTEAAPDRKNGARSISLAEARRIALAASEKIRQAQISYAEEEAKRSYDYRVEE